MDFVSVFKSLPLWGKILAVSTVVIVDGLFVYALIVGTNTVLAKLLCN